MNYKENAQALSNASVVDIFLIDEISEKFDYGDKINPKDIINLSRLIEAFVLNNEVVIRDEDLVWDPTLNYNNVFDYKFTENWIQTFSENNAIKTGRNSASTLLSNEYANFNSELRHLLGVYDKDSLDYYLAKNREDSTRTWADLTKFSGIPFITNDLIREKNDANRYTNISLDLYNRMENYYKEYFSKISKYLGPTYIRIPSLLSMVLQNSKSIDDIPKVTMQIRDYFSKFNMEVTELEYQLRVSNNSLEQIEIINTIENCYNNIVQKKSAEKVRIQSRIFDVVQNFEPASMASEVVKQLRKVNIEEKGTLLIPGYYSLWKAADEVEQAMPLLKRIFGNQIDEEFLVKLHQLSI